MSKVALILPAYNEEKTIEKTIEQFYQVKPDLYFVIIDNNSKDKTSELAEATLKKLNCQYKLIHEKRQGKGYAVRQAFLDIDADIYVMSDADSTYPAHQLFELLAPVEKGTADIVVGNRHFNNRYKSENKRPLHNFGNHLVINLINLIYRSNVQDAMSGYRVFSKLYVKNFPILSPGFELETEMTLHTLEKKFRLIEIPIEYSDRPAGSFSKLNTFKDGFKVLLTIFNIFRFHKPLLFFGYLSLLFLTLGLSFGSVVISEYLNTGYITRLPLSVLATGLVISSLISITIGLILDNVMKINQFNYQMQILRFKSQQSD